jgi:hypothetical protein
LDYDAPNRIGLERRPAVFEAPGSDLCETRRVLKDNGTLWLNIGDVYEREQVARPGQEERRASHGCPPRHARRPQPKDLLGIPWRLALRLQEDGWYLRSDIIWHKPNAMPESVKDRPTRAHEYIFLLSTREQYYFDRGAVLEAGDRHVLRCRVGARRRYRGSADDGGGLGDVVVRIDGPALARAAAG